MDLRIWRNGLTMGQEKYGFSKSDMRFTQLLRVDLGLQIYVITQTCIWVYTETLMMFFAPRMLCRCANNKSELGLGCLCKIRLMRTSFHHLVLKD